jgi:flagellin-like hook-associated protein FlgL
MSELKGYATQDPLKGETDIASYNNEFKDLQYQLYQISQMDFNGMSLFANHLKNSSGVNTDDEVRFGGASQDQSKDYTIDIFTSSEGSSGPKVSIHKALLLSALTIKQTETAYQAEDHDDDWSSVDNSSVTGADDTTNTLTFAVDQENNTALNLADVSAGVFERALENVVFLRAQTGGGLSRLNFALDSISTQETNMRAALGRIEDVDIAAEAANLSKYTILMQASAAMVAQANSTNEVALMLLR